MASKTIDILRVSTRKEDLADSLKERLNAVKERAKADLADVKTDFDLLIFLLDSFEKHSGDGFTRHQKNLGSIENLVQRQMTTNETDNTTVKLGNTEVFINKRRITSTWIQSELGCSFGAVKTWLDSNQEMIDKHHAKFNIYEHQNRLASKAQKSLEKTAV
jgi:hypothetical protein